MQVVCIEDVRENDEGKLWCAKGTLYEARKENSGSIHIKSKNEKYPYSHCIFSDGDEMREFYERHFLEIVDYVE